MLHLTTNEAAIQQNELPARVHLAASCRTAEAGRMLAVIKGYKPCHAAIRQKGWQAISYDINGEGKKTQD